MKDEYTAGDLQHKIDTAFQSPSFQALTIGVPFCAFKLLFGLMSMRFGLLTLSYTVLLWASADLLMNLTRVFYDLAGRESPIEYCTIAQAGRLFGRPRLFLALDTFISFSIICFALWSGWIKLLSHCESYIWYSATTLNLISISAVNIWLEIKRTG
ncbi:MAG: hypothetical protein QUS09_06625 [Methanotrichaceae archaeon]|nr:hypothetical protein [Methanotrichaceae archaeon]